MASIICINQTEILLSHEILTWRFTVVGTYLIIYHHQISKKLFGYRWKFLESESTVVSNYLVFFKNKKIMLNKQKNNR